MTTICESPYVGSTSGSRQGQSEPKPRLDSTERHRLLGHTEEDLAFFQTHQPTSKSPPKDENESLKLGKRIRAIPKQCWFNARRAVLKADDYAQANYVEGWVVLDSGLWIEHGWVVRNGVLIDPTLPTGVEAYFPGLEFRGQEEIKAFLATRQGKKCRRSPFYYAYGWGGSFSPTMRKALTDADEYAMMHFWSNPQPARRDSTEAEPSAGC